MTQTKYRPLKIKQVPTDGSGIFTGLASTYGGEPDHQGDVVERGAFAESILKWRALGDYPPILHNHAMQPVNARIGKITSMHEIENGLLITAKLNLNNPRAVEVYEALLNGSLDQLSIGYATIAQYKQDNGKGGQHNVLAKLDLIEVSIVPVPANPRARILDVKSRTHARADKLARAIAIRKLAHANSPELQYALAERLQLVVADEAATVDDLKESAMAFLATQITIARTKKANSARLADRGVRAQLDDMTADLAVREKNQGRHESVSFEETNGVLVREHLLQRHPAVNAVQLDSTDVRTLNQLHKLDHGGGVPKSGQTDTALTKAVDDLINDVRWQANRDRADREAFEAANAAVQLSGRAPGFSPDAERERELDLQRRDLERLEQRAAERDAERASVEESARISREDRNWHGESYWTNDSAIPQPETVRDRVEPRVDDQTVPDVGTTFSAPVYGVEGSDYRLTPPETLPEAHEAAGETYRVRTSSVDTPNTVVPTETETFRIYAHQPEDSKLVAPEPPVPENLEVGPTFRMPAGGENKREQSDDIRIPKGGEVE